MSDVLLPPADTSTRIESYLALLQKPGNRPLPQTAPGPEQTFTALHEKLAGSPLRTQEDLSPGVSISARIKNAYPSAPIATDRHGRPRLVMTPPMVRAKMLPKPLGRNPLLRLIAWVRSLYMGRRGGMAIQRMSRGSRLDGTKT